MLMESLKRGFGKEAEVLEAIHSSLAQKISEFTYFIGSTPSQVVFFDLAQPPKLPLLHQTQLSQKSLETIARKVDANLKSKLLWILTKIIEETQTHSSFLDEAKLDQIQEEAKEALQAIIQHTKENLEDWIKERLHQRKSQAQDEQGLSCSSSMLSDKQDEKSTSDSSESGINTIRRQKDPWKPVVQEVSDDKGSSSPDLLGKRQSQLKQGFPNEATKILKGWLLAHQNHPYPSEDEKMLMVKMAGLTKKQVPLALTFLDFSLFFCVFNRSKLGS